MCGRFTLSKPVRVLAELFDLTMPPAELAPRYNVAPFQTVAAVGHRGDGTRRLAMLRWGLVPHWWNTPKDRKPDTNARHDATHKPTFRDAFRDSRCLIPADGFYEWVGPEKDRRPIHFRFRDERVFAFAGLFDKLDDGRTKLFTCCVFTTDPNPLVGQYHDRMPGILRPDQYAAWLDPDTPLDVLRGMLVPYPADEMTAVPVVPLANHVRNEGPECLTPAA